MFATSPSIVTDISYILRIKPILLTVKTCQFDFLRGFPQRCLFEIIADEAWSEKEFCCYKKYLISILHS